jgi:cytochrome c biogenesis protein CcmG, thiol:disulfide interchange protein DsbE
LKTTSESDIKPLPRKQNLTLLFFSLALPLAFVVLLGLSLLANNQGQRSSGPAPDFSLVRYDTGEAFTLSDYRGQVVLINFWASWCGPCRGEAAELNALWAEYRGKDVQIIGVGYNDNVGDARNFIAGFGITYPTGNDDGGLVSRQFRVRGVPETFFIDRNGEIAHVVIGEVDFRYAKPILDALLLQPARNLP